MTEPGSRATSGVFLKPVWRQPPRWGERAAALLITALVLAGLALLPLGLGRLCAELKPEKLEELKTDLKKCYQLSASTPAAPGGEKPAAPDTPENSKPAEDLRACYSLGREILAVTVASGPIGMKQSMSFLALGATAAMMAMIGVLMGFFGWQLRRLTAALGGALAFGGGAFLVAFRALDPEWLPALLVALPAAFGGALIGWHLVVLVTCLQAGSAVSATVLMAAFLLGHTPDPRWMIPCYLVGWGLATAAAYLFMARAMLVSGWAIWGALLLTFAALLSFHGLTDYPLPWEAVVALVTIFSVLGTLTQYRLAARAAEEAPEPVADPA